MLFRSVRVHCFTAGAAGGGRREFLRERRATRPPFRLLLRNGMCCRVSGNIKSVLM